MQPEEKYVGKNISMPLSMSADVDKLVRDKEVDSASAYVRSLIREDFKKRRRHRAKSK